MSAEDAFNTLKTYFETRPAARQALGALKDGVEISLVIGGTIECTLFQQDGQPTVERRPAQNPDVIFNIRPESVYVLSNQPGEAVGDVGVAIMKEMLAGNISVQKPGNLMNLIKNGYLEMISRGGTQVSAFLASRGLGSVTKIMGAIKSLKR